MADPTPGHLHVGASSQPKHVPNPENYFGITPWVFIIESPAPGEFESGFHEGQDLSNSLTQVDVPNSWLFCSSKRGFKQAQAFMLERILSRPRGFPVAATIHISAHGNEDGIDLHGGESLSWAELRSFLLELAERSQRLSPNGLSLQGLVLSTCCGAHASRMFAEGPPYPCIGIVGPEYDITWPEARMAFVHFYSRKYQSNLQIPQAVVEMNTLLGRIIFSDIHPPGIGNLISPRGADLCLAYEALIANNPG